MTKEERLNRISELLSCETDAAVWIDAILVELLRALKKHPSWPIDAVHAAAILAEESGELTQAALDFHYGGFVRPMDEAHGAINKMATEAVQCGAMSLRFLLAISHYAPTRGKEGQYEDARGCP